MANLAVTELTSSCSTYKVVCSSLSTVLRTRQPLPFCFYNKWLLQDFHISKWSRRRCDSQLRRTNRGRSCVDQPVMEMVSVNRYGGYEKRERLVTAFRRYRSVSQSMENFSLGRAAVQSVNLEDFAFDEDEMEEVAIDFACLYLNASILFEVIPSEEMIFGLFSRLSKVLQNSFHWECVFGALIVLLQPSSRIAKAVSTAFVGMLLSTLNGEVPKSFTRHAVVLLSLVIGRAISISNESLSAEDRQCLINFQQKVLEVLLTGTPLSEELFVLSDAICWRFIGSGGPLCGGALWLEGLSKQLQLLTSGVLETLAVSQCAQLFCSSCLVTATPSASASYVMTEKAQQKLEQDPIVSHLYQRVPVHSLVDTVCVLSGLAVNKEARMRYRKYPLSLLQCLRDEHHERNTFFASLYKNDIETYACFTDILTELYNTGDDDLADIAGCVLNELMSSGMASPSC
uniref:Uncharacterized protein TCIL3000_10_8400 n=1 Tax=Trypanosoma congolense (strain IL3000) TaxID=1068625 RepID=G0UXE7_TRYCI|nr:unnamed protein product [Trypanosoma congolense IL3000]